MNPSEGVLAGLRTAADLARKIQEDAIEAGAVRAVDRAFPGSDQTRAALFQRDGQGKISLLRIGPHEYPVMVPMVGLAPLSPLGGTMLAVFEDEDLMADAYEALIPLDDERTTHLWITVNASARPPLQMVVVKMTLAELRATFQHDYAGWEVMASGGEPMNHLGLQTFAGVVCTVDPESEFGDWVGDEAMAGVSPLLETFKLMDQFPYDEGTFEDNANMAGVAKGMISARLDEAFEPNEPAPDDTEVVRYKDFALVDGVEVRAGDMCPECHRYRLKMLDGSEFSDKEPRLICLDPEDPEEECQFMTVLEVAHD